MATPMAHHRAALRRQAVQTVPGNMHGFPLLSTQEPQHAQGALVHQVELHLPIWAERNRSESPARAMRGRAERFMAMSEQGGPRRERGVDVRLTAAHQQPRGAGPVEFDPPTNVERTEVRILRATRSTARCWASSTRQAFREGSTSNNSSDAHATDRGTHSFYKPQWSLTGGVPLPAFQKSVDGSDTIEAEADAVCAIIRQNGTCAPWRRKRELRTSLVSRLASEPFCRMR